MPKYFLNRCSAAFGAAVAVWLSTRCQSASAAPVVLTFEEFPGGTAIIAQYAARGVTFNLPRVFNYQTFFSPAIPGYAHSGSNGIEQCFATEFCTNPIEMVFTAPQLRVKAFIGLSFRVEVPVTVVLTGFNSGGAPVAQATLDYGPQGVRPIQDPLEAVSANQDIVRATISTLVGGQTGGTSGIAVDDIEFDTEGPPPVCNATDKAFLGLLEPKTGFKTQIGSYLLQGVIVSDAPLEESTLTVIGPDGTSRTGDLLGSGIVGINAKRFGPIRCSPLTPGVNRIQVSVKNCKGGETEEVGNIIYQPIPAGAKFILKGVEFTQSIQDRNNLVPLIARKRTMARVFLELNPPAGGTLPSIFDVTATMSATRPDGPPLGGPLSIQPLNKVIVNDTLDPLAEGRLESTLNFELPPEWITEGRIHCRLSAFSVEGQQVFMECVGCDQQFQFGSALFEEAPPVRVVLFEVPWTDDGETHTPGENDFNHLESWLRRAFPTADVESSRSQIAGFTGLPDDGLGNGNYGFDCDDVNARLFQQIAMCACAPQVRFYGMVADLDLLGMGIMRGCARGIPGRVSSGPSGRGPQAGDGDGSFADIFGAHEIAHSYGRKHPGFCPKNSEDDDDYPYPGGKIGILQHGFDFGVPSFNPPIPTALYSPGKFTDLMTYCDFKWVSDYTYKGILSYLRSIEGQGGGGGEGGALADGLMVQGRINLTQNYVTLRPFLRLAGLVETDRPAQSPFAMELRSAAGAVLAMYAFEVAEDTEPPPGSDRTGSFDLVVPWANGARRIVILKSGQVLAARDVSRSAPQVHLDSPNGPFSVQPAKDRVRVIWSAQDEDGDSLTFALQYSNDDGSSWIPIDTGLTVYQVDVPQSKLPGGELCRFRIIATDGVNTSHDDQDEPMPVLQKLPNARILNPASGIQVFADQPLIFLGEGLDLEDGRLSGDDLIWSSDVQRIPLGTGAAFTLRDPPLGLRRFSLSARDSTGAVGVAAVEIEVLPAPLVAVAVVDSPVQQGSHVVLDGTQSTGQGTLDFSWTLVSKPVGSAGVLSQRQQPVANLLVGGPGEYQLQLVVTDSFGQSGIALPVIQVVSQFRFKRGEATGDAGLDLSDPVRILAWLFTGGAEPVCLKAADANNDEAIDLTDGVLLLNFLFTGGRAPAAPFPACGVDPTGDGLSCKHSPCP